MYNLDLEVKLAVIFGLATSQVFCFNFSRILHLYLRELYKKKTTFWLSIKSIL